MAKPKKKRGVRIPFVEDARGGKFGRDAIDVKPHPPCTEPLKCFECGVEVSTSGTATPMTRTPSRRTTSRILARTTAHAARTTSSGAARSSWTPPAALFVRKDGQWRLICPPLERLGTRGAGKGVPGPVGGSASGTGKVKSCEESGQAIASARRIVRLLDAFEQDPDDVAEFAAAVPGVRRNIEWPEFCRGRADVHRLAQELIDGTVVPTPHAVWGTVSTADAVDGKGGRSYVVKYVARHPVLVDGRRLPLQVTLRSTNADWIGATTRSGQFLGYGYWTLFPKPENARSHIELQLWIKEPWQAAWWDTDGTTQAFPAPPPRPVPLPGNARSEQSTPVEADQLGGNAGIRPAGLAPPTSPEQAESAELPTPLQPVSRAATVPGARAEPQPSAGDRPDRPGVPSLPDEASVPEPLFADAAQASVTVEAHGGAPDPLVPPKPSQPPRPASSPPPPSRRRRGRLIGWLSRHTRRR
ncbi:hypothetical protein [Streptomyces sp. NPDC058268]|uniref:hypothetical protein n=1 Tax=Streptomyces sp. NPDC058268 TaxID=3346413 RepID=UPI0036E861DC